jgi:two-component system chemotaxis response regulator CheY
MSRKALIADPSRTMRKILLRSLAALGIYEAVEAGDGAEALEAFHRGGIDLVLTDWNMPHKSGLELIQDIRRTDAATPIIMVTTEAEKSRVLAAIQAGCTDYLVKPFTADALREKLAKYVE